MNDLLDSGAESVTDPDGALMVTNAINSIIGGSVDRNTFQIKFFFFIFKSVGLHFPHI